MEENCLFSSDINVHLRFNDPDRVQTEHEAGFHPRRPLYTVQTPAVGCHYLYSLYCTDVSCWLSLPVQSVLYRRQLLAAVTCTSLNCCLTVS